MKPNVGAIALGTWICGLWHGRFRLFPVEVSWNCMTPHMLTGCTSTEDTQAFLILTNQMSLFYINLFTSVPGSARRALVICSYLVTCFVRCHIRMTSHPGDAYSCQDQDLISGSGSFCCSTSSLPWRRELLILRLWLCVPYGGNHFWSLDGAKEGIQYTHVSVQKHPAFSNCSRRGCMIFSLRCIYILGIAMVVVMTMWSWVG